MADAVANSFLVIVLPLYISSGEIRGETYGLTPAAVTGVILAVFGLANAFLQPFAGRLSDRVGRRKVFVLGGLLVLAVLNGAYAVADSYVLLALLRVGQGLSVAFTVTASVALVNEVSTRSTRGGNMGVYNSLRLLGFGSGPLAAGFIVSAGPYAVPGLGTISGFDAAFYLAALGALASSALVLFLVRDPERTKTEVGAMAIAVRARDGRHLLDPIFTLGIATLVMASCVALLASIEPVVNERLGQGPRWFGVQFAVFILSLAVTQPLVGRASDRRGRLPFVLWGLVTLAPTTLAQGLVTTPMGMVVARLAQGVSGALIFAPALALAGDLARKEHSGLQLSVLTMAFVLGLSAGQLSAGFLVAWGYVVPFAFGSVLALAAALLVRAQVDEPPPSWHPPGEAPRALDSGAGGW
jgi:MFS family permease